MDLSPEEDNFPGRLFHQAALWDNAELLEDLVSGATEDDEKLIDATDGMGRTALHAAATCEHSRCMRILLRAGANPDKASNSRAKCKTPLHVSAERGDLENVKALLDAGASWDVRDLAGNTPLLLAELGGYSGVAKLLKDAQEENERLRASHHAELRAALSAGSSLRESLDTLGNEAELIVNMAPGGANTLLFTASEMGSIDAVKALITAGADGRSHPVTRYSPLYVACYHGNKEIAEILLLHFPEMVQQQTVERWLPLHASCINGHMDLVSLLLNFPYPEKLMTTYRNLTGEWEYKAVFDINHRDVSGQTALYVACLLGNKPIVDILLRYTIKAAKVSSQSSEQTEEPSTPSSAKNIEQEIVTSPTRKRISDGIQSILSKLSLSSKQYDSLSETLSEQTIKPINLDAIIGITRDTCLRAAVRGRHMDIAKALLTAGADPNAPSVTQHSNNTRASIGSNQSQCSVYSNMSQNSTITNSSTNCTTTFANIQESISLPALVEACKARDHSLVELLLKHGAKDLNCLALKEAVHLQDETLISRLLAIKAYPDPEYKINKRGMTESMSINGLLSPGNADSQSESENSSLNRRAPLLTYSAMFPSQPAMLNWHNQSCRLTSIKISWIQDAALHVNSRLQNSPRGRSVALHAITRLDLSGNALTLIPLAILQMTSIRYLNVAQNKLEKLPLNIDSDENSEHPPTRGRRSRRSPMQSNSSDDYYTAPVLEEIYLQENRLEYLPDALFSLPALTTLDVSNNKLKKLPYALWRSPRLRDLNASLNLLKDLPLRQDHVSVAEDAGMSVVSPNSSQDVRIPSSNSSGHLSSSSNSFNSSNLSSSSNIQRRSWSVDRASGIKSETSRDSFSEPGIFDEESLPYNKKVDGVMQQDLRKHHLWTRGLEIAERPPDPPPTARCSRLAIFNLAHNQFISIPAGLPCLAPSLSRLNLSYNGLRSMSHVTSYPNSLKQLDLSHNKITCWPSLPQVDSWGPLEQGNLLCYCPGSNGINRTRARSASGVRKAVLAALCPARRHLRLDGLRTLVLGDNLLTRIQLTTDDDGGSFLESHDKISSGEKVGRDGNTSADDDDDWNLLPIVRTRLLFPNLSMLDVSNNMLKYIPPTIHELSNLSVLNISGNTEISELPPQMGLLNRLWNLNTYGCPLQEPLRSMIDSKKYKTMDIIGYLKSVLEDAKPYARMKLMVVGIQGIGKTSLLDKLRQESAPAHRRRPPEHWAKRMGNKNINTKTSRGTNISTVGVDIGDWIYDRHPARSGRSAHGPVIFRTWDFGGQKEYYSTHQYFLSRRSLYIVVWKVSDGLNGLAGIQHWLVSIQARAPNSPVIIVGTHYDAIADMPPEQSPEQLQRIIRERFISIADPEKRGLPRVLDSVEVSCMTRHNIRLLSNLIYDTVFNLRQPGSKELLLEQRIPASYLALEDAVGVIAAERRSRGLDPVLTHEQFKQQVAQYMQQKFHRGFRDQAELHQATMFLHDNGVLLHYDDATLKDLYFLDPQWLCDMLAHVVTVREINPFARLGLMRLEDLQLLFKSTRAGDSREYVVSLLNKFEVALSWDGRSLLLPPLLPALEPPSDGMGISNCVKIPMKTKGWMTRGHKKIAVSPLSILNQNAHGLTTSGSIVATTVPGGPMMSCYSTYGRSHPLGALRRLLIASYSPCGFWPRLITRLLADDTISDIVDSFYQIPEEFANDSAIMRAANQGSDWWPWQSGLRLTRSNILLLTVREVPQENSIYRNIKFRLKQEGIWGDVDTISSSILEIFLPCDEMIIKRPITDEQGDTIGYQNICIEPSIEAIAKLLVLVVDHIDILLEDWYPTLGTRFVHTSEGRFLVTRLVPCPSCLINAETAIVSGPEGNAPKSNEIGENLNDIHSQFQEAFKRAPREDIPVAHSRASQESTTSDGDSGVGPDSTGSSRMPSMEGVMGNGQGSQLPSVHAWMIEECILQAGSSMSIDCPTHQETLLAKVAPDVVFLDLGPHRLAASKDLTRGALIGRGAFGLVFRAEWRNRGPVALKVLQPVPPGSRAPASALAAYKAAAARWDRDPAQAACRAYLSARGEMGVLLPLRHPNVAPFLAACTSPLSLVLALAPMGALDGILRGYRQSGARLGPHCAQAVAVQAARALEYLHRQRVIYRDLKAENVLVWEMPPPVGPFKDHPDLNVHIKVADYGISRLTLPSGTKGFGGTEGFMAPEIMRYNGEEEYTEKVDCFSFGMFLYELLTLRQPFEGHEAVKECVLEGGRPALTHKETLYPCYMLDLMVACWSGQPEQRPSASQIVSIASAPEFTHLADVVSLHHTSNVTDATATQITNITDEGVNGWEIWIARSLPRCDILAAVHARWTHYNALPVPAFSQDTIGDNMILPTAVCSLQSTIWIGDSTGHIHAYDSSDCRHIFSYALESNKCEVAALLHLPSLGRVAAALSNGRLFLLDSNAAPLSPTAGEGTFVMTELGAASTLRCLAAVSTDEYCELWCGGDSGGGVSIYRLIAGIGAAGAHELACPVPPITPNAFVLHAVAGENMVYTYLYPGCVIYQWDAFEKTLLARLDCSKLVPCSESLRSIAIEEHLSPGRCQVTSLAVLNDDVYIGTTWGCIIIAEKDTLRPVTIFRPYEEEVRAIIPLPPYKNNSSENIDIQSNDLWQDNGTPLIATIGRGYRSLLARYTDAPNQCSTNTSLSQGSGVIHCLLWRAEHWAAN